LQSNKEFLIMLEDHYGNPLSTNLQAARDAYVEGVDYLLAASHKTEDAFRRAIVADSSFALAHAALARTMQIQARSEDAVAAMASAQRLTAGISVRERSHIAAYEFLIHGNGPAAYSAIVDHLEDYPRDVLMVEPCTSVFGLIGLSGQPGREAQMLAFMHRLAPHYGDDWWFNAFHAFAQVETGQIAASIETIERSFAGNRRNANAAHIRSHIYYENGEADAGFAFLDDWRKDYDRRAPMHCHLSWHVALWALERGEDDRAWQVVENDVRPSRSKSPPLNVMTDTASFLLRAELAGGQRRLDLWHEVSTYASKCFPNTGMPFIDVHAALAYAMAGCTDALDRIIAEAKGPACDLVPDISNAFRAFTREDWSEVIELLVPVMSKHERIGGSRAQRDLIEFTLLNALLKTDRAGEARHLLSMRRPAKVRAQPVQGL
jgi:hypothetical protein